MTNDTELAGASLVAEVAPPPQLLTMEPKQYVDTAFADLDKELAGAVENVGKVVHDVTTASGMEAAKEGRKTFRQLRWVADRLHKEYKAPVLQLGRLIDSRYNQIKDAIAPYELHYDKAIEAEEERLAVLARAREHAEMERIATIERRIAGISSMPAQALGRSSSIIETLLIALDEMVIDASYYAEYEQLAQEAKNKAAADLNRALLQTRAAEANLAELEQLRRQHGTPAVDDGFDPCQPALMTPGDVIMDCYRYLVGLDQDYDTLLANVTTTLEAMQYHLPTA